MFKHIAILAAALALAFTATADARSKARAASSCPSVSILMDAVRITQMKAGRIDMKAEIREPALTCSLAGGTAKAKLSFWVKGAISPNSDIAPRQVPYFVAIIAEGKVIGKEVFTMAIPFTNGKRKISVKEQIARIDIPITDGKTADDYSVTIGFQLTEEQVNYNRTASR